MPSVKINDKFAVAGQLSLAEIGALGGQGFTTLINNRPEGEEAAQPSIAAETAAATAAGLAYVHIPVRAPSITPADVDAFGEALESAPGPVLAHCRSGLRSLMLYALAQARSGRLDRDGIEALGDEVGVDLSGAIAWLDRHGVD